MTFINKDGNIIIYTKYINREDHDFDNEKYSFLIQILLSEISDIHFQYIERQHRTVCSYVSNNVQYRSAIGYNPDFRMVSKLFIAFFSDFGWKSSVENLICNRMVRSFFSNFNFQKSRQHVKLSVDVHNMRLIW